MCDVRLQLRGSRPGADPGSGPSGGTQSADSALLVLVDVGRWMVLTRSKANVFQVGTSTARICLRTRDASAASTIATQRVDVTRQLCRKKYGISNQKNHDACRMMEIILLF